VGKQLTAPSVERDLRARRRKKGNFYYFFIRSPVHRCALERMEQEQVDMDGFFLQLFTFERFDRYFDYVHDAGGT